MKVMKISDLLATLEKIKHSNGDLTVYIEDSEYLEPFALRTVKVIKPKNFYEQVPDKGSLILQLSAAEEFSF